MAKSAVKFVIFDIGGVIISFRDEYVLDKFAMISGVKKSKVHRAASSLLNLLAKGKINEKIFWKLLIKETNAKVKLYAVENLWLEVYRKRLGVRKDIFNMARKLGHEYRAYALSNTYKLLARHNRKTGLYKPFRRTFLSCYMGAVKPERRIYTAALKSINASPGECVFIDDNMKNVTGARKAGIRAIHFRNAAQLRRALKKMGVKIN